MADRSKAAVEYLVGITYWQIYSFEFAIQAEVIHYLELRFCFVQIAQFTQIHIRTLQKKEAVQPKLCVCVSCMYLYLLLFMY